MAATSKHSPTVPHRFFFSFLLGSAACIAILSCTGQIRNVDSNFTRFSGAEFARESQRLDVPYVVTHQVVVKAMLNLASVKPDEFLIDLGSGDGRINIISAKHFGARGFGVDLNDKLVELSKRYAAAAGVADRVDFYVKDIFFTDISKADIVTMYLLPEINLRLRPKLLNDLKPGARVISQDFHMEDWRPDDLLTISDETGEQRDLYLWIIPARVEGKWRWSLPLSSDDQNFILELNQYFQDIAGVALSENIKWRIFDTVLRGDEISFSLISEAGDHLVRQDYRGRVKGGAIEGTVQLSGTVENEQMEWRAERIAD